MTVGNDVAECRDICELSCDVSSATHQFEFAFENPFVLV